MVVSHVNFMRWILIFRMDKNMYNKNKKQGRENQTIIPLYERVQ